MERPSKALWPQKGHPQKCPAAKVPSCSTTPSSSGRSILVISLSLIFIIIGASSSSRDASITPKRKGSSSYLVNIEDFFPVLPSLIKVSRGENSLLICSTFWSSGSVKPLDQIVPYKLLSVLTALASHLMLHTLYMRLLQTIKRRPIYKNGVFKNTQQ
jgi:hypothetical protein